ncbi:MAG: hypothetical protein CSA65_03425 [Proteobacteria bacterium]|nr:MAG: hypothetical protein CSA65_03425 [Pseudomonadota bacterium]
MRLPLSSGLARQALADQLPQLGALGRREAIFGRRLLGPSDRTCPCSRLRLGGSPGLFCLGLVCLGLVCLGLVCLGLVCLGLVCLGLVCLVSAWALSSSTSPALCLTPSTSSLLSFDPAIALRCCQSVCSPSGT